MSLFTLYVSVKARLLTRSRAVQALLLICFLGGLASATAYAQSGPVCTTYTTKTTGNGLGSNVVNAVFALTATAPASNTIYAATNNGLSISTDGGNSFSNKTREANGLPSNNVTCVYVLKGTSPGSTTIYAATHYAGVDGALCVSTDGGNSFTTILNVSDVEDLFVLPATTMPGSATIYAVGYGMGMYISTDGGSSFVQKGTNDGFSSNRHTNSVYALPANTTPGSTTVYAGGRYAFRISTNGGNSFIEKTPTDGYNSGYENTSVFALPPVTTPGSTTIYAGSGYGLNISTDGGNSFTTLAGGTNGLGSGQVSGVYAIGRTVYAATDGGLSISTDGGQTFTTYTKAANGLGDDVVNDVIVAGNTIYAATNGGLSSCAAPLQCLVLVSPASQTITSGGSATLIASGATSYTWSNGSTENPLVLTDVTSATTLSVTGVTGTCSATASAAVSVSSVPCGSAPQNITVSGISDCYADGEYAPDGLYNGVQQWLDGPSFQNYIRWTGSEWELYTQQGGFRLASASGTPDMVPSTGWVNVEGCSAPTMSGGAGKSLNGASITVSPASQTITSGGSATLTASGADSFTWSNGSIANPLILTNVTSAITLSVTGVTGVCSGTASAEISVTVSEQPVALSVTSPAIDQPLLVLSTGNCPVTFSGQGWGKSFVITNTSGYVFSSVYRNFIVGKNISASGIHQPGTYTVTVSGNPGQTPVSYTFSVTGTGCN